MNFNSPHQRNSESSLFGILASRLLFVAERSASRPAHHVEESEVGRTRGTSAPEALRADHENMKTVLSNAVGSYNDDYDEDITLNLENPAEMQTQVRGVLDGLRAKLRTTADLSESDRNKLNEQIQKLEIILDHGLAKYIELKADMARVFAPERAVDVQYAHRSRLRRNFDRIQDGRQNLEAWGNEGLYQRIEAHFEQVSNNPEFESFWMTPEGAEANKHTEARQLFMSILAEQTEGFKKPIFFGENFSNNATDNIRNYPFIYNEWLKKMGEQMGNVGLSLEAIRNLETKVNTATAEANRVGTISELIANAGPASGLDASLIMAIPTSPKDERAAKMAEVLTGFVANLEKKAGDFREHNEEGKARNYEGIAKKLKAHLALAKAEYDFYRMSHFKERLDADFTADNFASETNQRTAIELSMLQFKKAMELVDQPLGEGADWREFYHPTVRRTLIATMFHSGVARNVRDEEGVVRYDENLGERKSDLLSALSRSQYFNRTERGRFLSSERRKALAVIEFGFEVTDFLENTKDVPKIIELTQKARLANTAGNEEAKKSALDKLARYPRNYVERFGQMSDEDLNNAASQYATDVAELTKFLDAALKLLKDPTSADSQKLLAAIEAGTFAGPVQNQINEIAALVLIDGPQLANYDRDMQRMDANYNSFENQHQSDLKLFESLGIRLEGVYPLYQAALQKEGFEDMTIEHWNEYLRDPSRIAKLSEFIGMILPEGAGMGKADFMASLRSLHEQDNLEAYLRSPEIARDHAIVLQVFGLLKGHLRKREVIAGEVDSRQKKIKARDRGVNVGDMVSQHVGNAWEMLVGSGQTLSNRMAGGILIYGLYKAARKAMKGDDNLGKMLRAAFVGGAAEIFMKESTGKGILDRFGIDPLQDAMEGTYEAVLVQNGQEFMDQSAIDQREHERALQQMRTVPFHVLMEWHDRTDSSGKLVHPEGNRRYQLPRGIRSGALVVGDQPNVDKNQRASLILRKAMDNFFTYVGNKDNEQGYEHGVNVVKERWYTMIDNRGHVPEHTEAWFQGIADIYRGNREALTWAIVVENEIDPYEVERTKQQTVMGQAEEMAVGAWDGFTDWARQYTNKFEGTAEIFFSELGGAARETSAALGGLIDSGARELYFAKESVQLWYGAHKYEIKRVAEQHWEIAVTGVTLPFKFIYGVDQFVMPYALSKIKQIEQVLSTRQESEITAHRDLAVTDIVSNSANEGFPNVDINPEYSYFGEYQRPFREAFEADLQGPNKYHEDDSHIGYYISEVGLAGINMSTALYQSQPENVRNKMLEQSREEAIKYYIKKGRGVPRSEIEKYLYPIHTVNKTTDPPKMYVFWRLPMLGSAELALRQSGRWAEFADPNRFKDRGPFVMDPSKTKWENFAEAMSLDMDPVRGVISSVSSYAIQLPRLAFGTVEALGVPIKAIAKWMGGAKSAAERKRIDDAVEIATRRPETQRRWLDEVFCSAKNPNQALSAFYRVPLHAKLFDFSLQFAHDRTYGGELFTGLLEGKTVNVPGEGNVAYETSPYLHTRNPIERYQEMLRYYTEVYSRSTGGADAQILTEINSKLTAAQRVVVAPRP